MQQSYQVIDRNGWKRDMHCRIFENSVEPQYCISFELDITEFLRGCRALEYSFTLAMIYAVTECASETEEFRYRFLDGKVVLYNRIHTSFTYLEKDEELFKVVNVPMQDSMEAYIEAARKAAEAQKEYFTGPLGNDVYSFSPLPWIFYTHISHTNAGRQGNAVPLFDWGKYLQRDEKTILPFSVQVHHSFVDGVHVGKFAERLQNYLDTYFLLYYNEKNNRR
ncbi:CatA-like O-acetyltransferase [Ruminococcus sp. OA3]|uniref:CatA-like O-acetyltransferase n=1 Tax=Ruminococcus sp. OA3 TaxID=2914164 RepID=UPI001F0533B9|nr:CatA-like O-acetyltransferase [Ruminococcus sp. OA3]MCH1984355.1 CatA-like O-acetyltransferase [Ruminococcus sp. OA3]